MDNNINLDVQEIQNETHEMLINSIKLLRENQETIYALLDGFHKRLNALEFDKLKSM